MHVGLRVRASVHTFGMPHEEDELGFVVREIHGRIRLHRAQVHTETCDTPQIPQTRPSHHTAPFGRIETEETHLEHVMLAVGSAFIRRYLHAYQPAAACCHSGQLQRRAGVSPRRAHLLRHGRPAAMH
jgi:hypothetical protein